MRANLFASPSGAFDSFASPVLFFHTPGYVVPPQWPGSETKPYQDRYSTSLDGENDDLVFEAPDFDVAGDGERGEAEIVGTTAQKKTSSSSDSSTVAEATSNRLVTYSPDIARTSYLKFPPTIATTNSAYSRFAGSGPLQEQLKLPRSLFLYSTPPSQVSEAGKKKTKKAKSVGWIDQLTPEAQAKEMARLIRRSVVMVESKDRTMWDDSYDASSIAEERARVLDVGEEDSKEKIKEWVENCLEQTT
jgi:hypothetical protein